MALLEKRVNSFFKGQVILYIETVTMAYENEFLFFRKN